MLIVKGETTEEALAKAGFVAKVADHCKKVSGMPAPT